MSRFHIKFVQAQTDGRTDRQTNRQTTVKQYAPDLSIRGHKKMPMFVWRALAPIFVLTYLLATPIQNLMASIYTTEKESVSRLCCLSFFFFRYFLFSSLYFS